jgi:hypothetical protein
MVETFAFVGELHRRNVRKGRFAEAHGITRQALSVMLRCPALPDDFLRTLDRIAPDGAPQGRRPRG